MHWRAVGAWTVLVFFLSFVYVDSQEDITSTILTLSKEDRTRFFTYQLYLGYFKRHANDLTRVPEETTTKIYDYFLTKYRMDQINDDWLQYITCQWLVIDGQCVDPDDPGIYPMLL